MQERTNALCSECGPVLGSSSGAGVIKTNKTPTAAMIARTAIHDLGSRFTPHLGKLSDYRVLTARGSCLPGTFLTITKMLFQTLRSNSKTVISGLAPMRIGNVIVPMPRLT